MQEHARSDKFKHDPVVMSELQRMPGASRQQMREAEQSAINRAGGVDDPDVINERNEISIRNGGHLLGGAAGIGGLGAGTSSNAAELGPPDGPGSHRSNPCERGGNGIEDQTRLDDQLDDSIDEAIDDIVGGIAGAIPGAADVYDAVTGVLDLAGRAGDALGAATQAATNDHANNTRSVNNIGRAAISGGRRGDALDRLLSGRYGGAF